MFSTIGAAAANPTQVAENLPASIVGMKPAFLKPPAKKIVPAYGLVFRFKVVMNDVSSDLGRWQSCGGLRVDFKPQDVRSGGDYTAVRYLPGEASYPKIVLKRAVDRDSSQAVQDWLKVAAIKWINGADHDGVAATIALLDSYGERVLTWHLTGVRPSSWSGPDLDANSSKVAIETLELVHEGFEVVARGMGRGASPSMETKPKPLTLSDHKDPSKSVKFWNAPLTMTLERNSDPTVLPTASGDNIAVGEKAGMTRLKMSNLYVVAPEGAKLVDTVKQLVDWATSADTGEKNEKGVPIKKLPLLKLEWGQFKYWGELTALSSDYVRFKNDGMPVRAKVGFSLTETAEGNPPTNPSSGGIPGRSGHLLVHNENLALLAHERYGASANWRAIAEANGIDDPLRVRPGDRLFLPAAAELSGRR